MTICNKNQINARKDGPFSLVPENLRGTCAAGEIVLATSVPFLRHRLRLYRKLSIAGQNIDYLVVQGNVPLMAIVLTENMQTFRPEDNPYINESWPACFPILLLPRERMEQGQMQQAISHLASAENYAYELSTSFASSMEPIPLEYHAKMAELHMIQREKGHLWTPTLYGRSLGLIDGYLPPDTKGKYLHTLFVLPQYKEQLDEILNWKQNFETGKEIDS